MFTLTLLNDLTHPQIHHHILQHLELLPQHFLTFSTLTSQVHLSNVGNILLSNHLPCHQFEHHSLENQLHRVSLVSHLVMQLH